MENTIIKHYEVKIDYAACHAGGEILVATIKVDRDLTEILPYINALAEKAKYLSNLNWIKFNFKGFPEECKGKPWTVAIQGDTISLRPFLDKDVAKEICDECIKYINDIISRKGQITPSYKEWKQPKAIDIFKYLPKSNCKKCGLPTCMSFATKLSLDEVAIDDCPELIPDSENYQKIAEMF
ncbi:hypothetical protein TKV_c19550 [Thermoanaerobacter kivui]|uniref:4Fe-4S domain-containing protein n=1 Tax=Thermoanaerobacter kivui TaxID=2325 RepID=A0A097ATH5_THEKI|nr:(Fe-S)-binding protein [Thermoanaerobacter kivui]AIS53099.1 hypothetical protein TKV_c19550 [Thermoanaerobacter kivui]